VTLFIGPSGESSRAWRRPRANDFGPPEKRERQVRVGVNPGRFDLTYDQLSAATPAWGRTLEEGLR